MQNQSNIQHIDIEKYQQKNEDLNFDGYKVAQLFLYYRRTQNPYLKKHLPLKLVSAKKLYAKHQHKFDVFAQKANKIKFDVDSYIKFCVIDQCINESTLDLCIASTTMIDAYQNHLNRVLKRKKIYAWIMKSIKNIAEYCVENDYFLAKDFLRFLIDTNQIGAYVASGKISIYYFAAIPNFKNIICKLDYFSRNELQYLEKYFDIYHADVNDAFIYVKNKMLNAIDVTDDAIFKLRQKKISITV